MSADDYLETYAADGMKKLNAIVDKIVYKYRTTCEALGICQMDYDDLYSIAAETLWKVCERYNGEGTFEGFLYKSLENKVLTYFTYRRRDRLMPKQRDSNGKKVLNEDGKEIFLTTVSINSPVDATDTEETLVDTLQSEYDLENDIVSHYGYSEKTEEYLKKLSKTQRKMLDLLADDYKPCEIQAELHITQREYTDNLKSIHAYENISILF